MRLGPGGSLYLVGLIECSTRSHRYDSPIAAPRSNLSCKKKPIAASVMETPTVLETSNERADADEQIIVDTDNQHTALEVRTKLIDNQSGYETPHS